MYFIVRTIFVKHTKYFASYNQDVSRKQYVILIKI
jgi:hypothetical protein